MPGVFQRGVTTGMASELASLFQRADPVRYTCRACRQPLGARVLRPPSAAYPHGLAEPRPCARCAHPSYQRAPSASRSVVRLTAVHRRVRALLGLDAHGFLPEQWVGPYRCDDVHYARKLVVEANGDYVHANPALYGPGAVVAMPGNTYTAREKWAADAARTASLVRRGYRVHVVWESEAPDAALRAFAAFLAG